MRGNRRKCAENSARAFNSNVYKIEKVEELQANWFLGKEKVGLIGANETPAALLDEAVDRLRALAA